MQANQANVTFDTHKAVKALKSSGFDEKQAEAVVETIDTAVNETVATKADLAVLTKTVESIQENIDKNMATKTDLALMGAELGGVKKTVRDIQDDIKENMATKSDLALLKKTVEDIDKNMATKDEIAKLETRMLRMMLLQTLVLVSTFGALIFAAIKLL